MNLLNKNQDQLKDAIDATWSANDCWGQKNKDHNFEIVRAYFFNLIEHSSSSEFEKYKDHSFWKNWRSEKSKYTRGALHAATLFAKDLGWIEHLLEYHKDDYDYKISAILSAFNNDPCNTIDILELYQQSGVNLQDYSSLDISFNLLYCAIRTNYWPNIKYILDKNIYTKRTPEIETYLIDVNAINLGGHIFKNYQKGCPSYFVLDKLWSVWGVPNSTDLRRISRKSLNHFSNGSKTNRVLTSKWLDKEWNHHHPKWEDNDTVFYYSSMLKQNRMQEISDKIEQGLVLNDQSLEKLHLSLSNIYSYHCNFDKLKSMNQKAILKDVLSESNLDISRLSRKKYKI